MRLRSLNQQVPSVVSYDYQYRWGSGIDHDIHYGQMSLGQHTGEYKAIQDEPHPGFRKIRANGGVVLGNLILNHASRVVDSMEFTHDPVDLVHGYIAHFHGDVTQYVEAANPIPDTVALSDRQNLVAGAIVKAYSAMNASASMVGEFASDIEQTVSMLRHPLSGSTSLLKKILKARDKRLLKSGSNLLQANANAWLEYRYGWKPLMMDVSGIYSEVKKTLTYHSQKRLVARSGCATSGRKEVVFTDKAMSDACSVWLATGSGELTQKLTANAGVIYACSTHDQNSLSRILGCRVNDIPATVWEIIPYSFVADWFVSVGDWITAMTPNPFVTIRGSWVTLKTVSERIYSGGSFKNTNWNPPGVTLKGSWGRSEEISELVERTINPQLPTTPLMKPNIASLLHTVDGLSLLCKPIVGLLAGLRH